VSGATAGVRLIETREGFEHLLRRLAREPLIGLDDVRPASSDPAATDAGVRPTLAELEHDYIMRVLEETKWDKRAAARILGVSVRTLQRRTPPSRGQSAA
jgi:transcriptional regulator with GAF, ATPase, and Fis domain